MCCNCPNLLTAVSVSIAEEAAASQTDASTPSAQADSEAAATPAASDYVATITVPADFAPTGPQKVCVLLRCAIADPDNVSCCKVIVTNGTDKWPVLVSCGDNWRPCKIKCRSILTMQYLTDPAHFVLQSVRR